MSAPQWLYAWICRSPHRRHRARVTARADRRWYEDLDKRLGEHRSGKFSGRYAHRTLRGGIGHNLPQEAPRAFAQAIVDVDGF